MKLSDHLAALLVGAWALVLLAGALLLLAAVAISVHDNPELGFVVTAIPLVSYLLGRCLLPQLWRF